MGVVVVEAHEDWVEATRYLNMEVLNEQLKQQRLERASARARRSSKPARRYIWRLIILRRLICSFHLTSAPRGVYGGCDSGDVFL
jgi:hypothetical protein